MIQSNTNSRFAPGYLGNTDSFDVYVRLESKVHSCAVLSDAELGGGDLHRRHLLAEVGRHHMLTQGQHGARTVGRQQIQAGAPLEI